MDARGTQRRYLPHLEASIVIQNDALAITLVDPLDELGGIPAERVRTVPVIRKAQLSDLIRANESDERG